jgi:hypothetical protein
MLMIDGQESVVRIERGSEVAPFALIAFGVFRGGEALETFVGEPSISHAVPIEDERRGVDL